MTTPKGHSMRKAHLYNPIVEISKIMPVIPPAVHTDLFEVYRSLLRAKKLADIVVALHEPRYTFTDRIL